MTIEELKKIANNARFDTLKAFYTVRSGHPGGCLSAAEIFTVLYNHVMNVDPKNPNWEDRDRFMLSKGHAAPLLFAILSYRGFFETKELLKVRKHDGLLQATPNPHVPGCDSISGSLGQNLSIAIGSAMAAKLDGKKYRTYCMVGDGELEEGQNWEALMLAPRRKLGNLVCIVDNNHVQMCGTNAEILGIEDVEAKFKAFGWKTICVNGHDIEALIKAFDSIPNQIDGIPTAIICDTVKGKGVSFMEGQSAWHGGAPSDEQWEIIKKELGGGTL